MGILKILLIILLFVLPLGAIGRVHVFSSVYINLFDVILGFTLIVSTYYHLKQKSKNLPFIKWILAFLGFGFLSLLLNAQNFSLIEIGIAFLYLARIVLYANLIYVFLLLKKDFSKRYVKFLSMSGFSVVVFGFIQYFFFRDLKPLFFLGWDEHLYRLFSTFLDPNFTGAILVIVLLLLITVFFEKKHRSKLFTFLSLVSIFVTTISVLLTYSRSTFIMLIVSVVAYLILVKKKKLLLYALAVLMMAFVLIPQDYNIENMNPLRTASILGRVDNYKSAIKVFSTSPVYGIGFNTYRYAQRDLGLLDAKWEVSHAAAGVSNSFIFVLATTGVVGLGLFLNFWVIAVRNTWKQRAKKDIFFRSLVISSILGVSVHSLFENTFFYPVVLILIFILLGLRLVRDS